MPSLIIVGAGPFGREIHSWCLQINAHEKQFQFKGFLDDRPKILDDTALSGAILCSPEDYSPVHGDIFVVALGNPAQRRKYTELIEQKEGQMATLIHPTAVVGTNVKIGKGSILAPFSLITSDATIGNSVYLGPFSCISHDCELSDFVHICGNSCLAGNVKIGPETFLSISTSVIPNIRIGGNSFVGAGSVVTRNMKPNSRVFGNPAQKLPD